MEPSLAERLSWRAFVRDAGEDGRAVQARALAYLFGAGATLGFLGLAVLPAGYGANIWANVAILGLAYLVAALALIGFDRMPAWAFHLLLAGGTVCTTLGVYFNGMSPHDNEMFYLWVVVYSAYFFDWRRTAIQLGLIGLCYAVVLAVTEAGSDWHNRWIVTAGTLLMAGFLVGLLKERMHGMAERLGESARTDFLTGLLNRRGLQEAFDAELERTRRSGVPLCLLIGDLDLFKEVNDRLGHQAGDRALERVALILAGVARRIDTVARMGGEEFAVIAPGTDADGGLALAERLREAVAAAFVREDVPLTMSFGVAVVPLHGHTAETLLHHADQALYAAKDGGRNRSLVAPAPAEAAAPSPARSVPRGRRAA